MEGKIEKKIPSALPLYLAAAAFLVGAAVLPVYRLWAFVACAALAAAGYAVGRKLFPPRSVWVDAPQAPFATGEEALDAALTEARAGIDRLRQLDVRIPDEALSAQIRRMEKAAAAILAEVAQHPEKAKQIRKFLTYYLPTALKVLTSYADLSASGAGGENARSLLRQVEANAGTIAAAFEAQLDALFAGEVLDVSADLTVLEHMAAGDGFAETPRGEDGPVLRL